MKTYIKDSDVCDFCSEMKHACENKHWALTPEDIYVNALDIEVFKSSHFAREKKIQFIFFEL